MAGSELNYPREIVDAVATMQRAAKSLDDEMAALRNLVNSLAGSSKSAAVQAFDEAQQLWNKSGLAHNETLQSVAGAAGSSYDEMTSFDDYLAKQLG